MKIRHYIANTINYYYANILLHTIMLVSCGGWNKKN